MTTQPLKQPANVEAMDGEHTLLFASDYPHWDFDHPDRVAIPKGWREHVFDLNAREVYRKLGSEF